MDKLPTFMILSIFQYTDIETLKSGYATCKQLNNKLNKLYKTTKELMTKPPKYVVENIVKNINNYKYSIRWMPNNTHVNAEIVRIKCGYVKFTTSNLLISQNIAAIYLGYKQINESVYMDDSNHECLIKAAVDAQNVEIVEKLDSYNTNIITIRNYIARFDAAALFIKLNNQYDSFFKTAIEYDSEKCIEYMLANLGQNYLERYLKIMIEYNADTKHIKKFSKNIGILFQHFISYCAKFNNLDWLNDLLEMNICTYFDVSDLTLLDILRYDAADIFDILIQREYFKYHEFNNIYLNMKWIKCYKLMIDCNIYRFNSDDARTILLDAQIEHVEWVFEIIENVDLDLDLDCENLSIEDYVRYAYFGAKANKREDTIKWLEERYPDEINKL